MVIKTSKKNNSIVVFVCFISLVYCLYRFHSAFPFAPEKYVRIQGDLYLLGRIHGMLNLVGRIHGMLNLLGRIHGMLNLLGRIHAGEYILTRS